MDVIAGVSECWPVIWDVNTWPILHVVPIITPRLLWGNRTIMACQLYQTLFSTGQALILKAITPCVEERSGHVRLQADLFIWRHYHNQELISGILINVKAVIILQKHAVVTCMFLKIHMATSMCLLVSYTVTNNLQCMCVCVCVSVCVCVCLCLSVCLCA